MSDEPRRSHNPYIIGPPVEGGLFVGRKDILRQLAEMWIPGQKLQSVCLFGHRRMGKTSILLNLAAYLGAKPRVAYLDCQSMIGSTADILATLCNAIAAAVEIPPPPSGFFDSEPYAQFQVYWGQVNQGLADRGLIVALDEMEYFLSLIADGSLAPGLLGYLRALDSESTNVAFVFAGLHTLEEMTASYEHPFFASFIPIHVGFLDLEDIRQLLTTTAEGYPWSYAPEAIQRIHELTAGQPFLVQLLGFRLVRHYNRDSVRASTPDPTFILRHVELVINHRDLYVTGEYYFTGVWGQAASGAEGQQAILRTLAAHPDGLALSALEHATDLSRATVEDALDTLQHHDVVREARDRWTIIVELFRRWVLDAQTELGALHEQPLFVSYTESEQVAVDRLTSDLKEMAVAVQHSRDLSADRDCLSETKQQILESRAVVAVVNPNTMGSKAVRKEIEFALEQGKRLIPLLLRPADVPPRLAKLHWVDGREGRETWPGLLAALWGETARLEPPETFPYLSLLVDNGETTEEGTPPPLEPPETLPYLGLLVDNGEATQESTPPPSPEPLPSRPDLSELLEMSVRFTSDEAVDSSLIAASLFIPQSGVMSESRPFQPPLDDKVLDDLRWYLETFSIWPTRPDYDRADRIEAQMEGWGRALLDSVVTDSDAARMWQQFADAENQPKLLTIDATDPRVQRLPWELLADAGGHVFTAGIEVRRRLRTPASFPPRAFTLPVRVLVVVCRPDEAGFIDPRAVSLPLLNALYRLGTAVETEFLYPPTLSALIQRLRDRAAPPVHVVHFDGHGIYESGLGLGFLLFEDEEHRPDLVDANQLGLLLNRSGIPLMVLNACQSVVQEVANPYASIAARLIRAGMGSVVAMSHSILVSASMRFATALYGSLAHGWTIGQAVDEGRYALLSDQRRHTLTRRDEKGRLVEETVRLRDWFLPTLYQQGDDPSVFFADEAWQGPEPVVLPAVLTDSSVAGGLPADPLHGFQGRSREMLQLERALADYAVVVLHGFGGMGKTALAAEAGRWFHRMGRFPGGAAFVSFEHGGSLEQICSWVGQAVSGDPDFAVHGEGALVDRVGALIRQRPALIIFDNFESALGRDPVIPADELKMILDAVWSWVTQARPLGSERGAGWGSRLLITTRDTTFGDPRFVPSEQCAHILLGGLSQADALALAASVLDAHGIDRSEIERDTLVDLMECLGRHPLSLYLVLPHLRTYTPKQLTERFEELLPGFVMGEAAGRNESLAVSLEFSLRRLGQETRAALPALGVFQGSVFEGELLHITKLDAGLWQTARQELEAAALVSVESLPGIASPFLRFHPTLLPYLRGQLADQEWGVLEERFWRRYAALADYLYRTDTQTPQQARAIAQRELPNLRRALELAVEAEAITEAVQLADRIAQFLDYFGRWRERDAMLARIRACASREGGEGRQTKTAYLLASREGEALLQQGRAGEAERVFRALLSRIEAGMAYDDVDEAALDRALTVLQLGRCLEAQGRPGQAIDWHRRALAEFERLGESKEQARQMQCEALINLGNSHAALGQLDEAQAEYERALEISREQDDLRSVGRLFSQLGILAVERGELQEAERRNKEALEISHSLGEPRMQAVAWHQSGRVAEQAQSWDEAESCYREALRIREQIRDLPELANNYNRLALVAMGAGRPDDAERWYLQAVEIGEQLGDRQALATVCSNLAALRLSQDNLDESERYARRATAIKETMDLSAEPWTTYGILAQIADARGRADEAATWRRKEQESYAAYAGAAYRLPGWVPALAETVAGSVGGDQAATELVREILSQLEAAGWRGLTSAVQRVLDGERGTDALSVGLDREDAYIVRTILTRLSGEAAPSSSSPLSQVYSYPFVWSGGLEAAPSPFSPLSQVAEKGGPTDAGEEE
jgi:tetratricopeptide (TPR) repeat protein